MYQFVSWFYLKLGHLTMDCVKNHPKKYNLLKKLALAEVCCKKLKYRVTLLCIIEKGKVAHTCTQDSLLY